MGRGQFARSFRDLEVYQLAFQLAVEVFDLSRQFPREERYSLTDQLRRASRSIGAQIAEAWGKRQYPRHFASKLSDANAEQNETQHWIDLAARFTFIHPEEAARLNATCQSIGRMLQAMIVQADSFCGDGYAMHEEAEPYVTDSEPV